MSITRWHIATVAVLIAIAASFTSVANGFTYDDRPVIVENERVHTLGNVPKLFGQTYWPEQNGAALYRPVTLALFTLQWVVGNGSPRVFHLVNVALYAAVCAAVALLILALLPTGKTNHLIALGAAALFAAHPVHVEAVGNTVGQSELVVGLLLAVAGVIYVQGRRRGAFSTRRVAAVVGLYVLACMAKEHAVVFPALIVALELTLLGKSTDPARRGRWQTVMALSIAGLAFLALRGIVVGGVAGDFAHLAWRDATFADRLFTMLRVVPEWIRLLVWPARLSGDYSPREIEVTRELTSAVFNGALLLALVVGIAVLAWRRRPLIAFGILWTGIALLPVSNILVLSGVLLAERTLFLPSVGVIIVVAGVLEMLFSRSPLPVQPVQPVKPVHHWRRLVAAGAVAAIVIAGTVKSANRQKVWRDNPTFFAQLLKDAPLSYRAHWARGAYLFDAGNKPEGEKELRIAVELFPLDPQLIEDLATRYLRAGFCAPAVPRFRQVLELVPDRSTSRVGLVACLLRDGDYGAAAAEARVGLRYGTDSMNLVRLAQVADSLGGVVR